MCVQLRGSEARVPEQFLYGPEIRAAVQQVGRGTVPERVRPGRAASRLVREERRDHAVHASRSKAVSSSAEEERADRPGWGGGVSEKGRPARRDPTLQRIRRRLPERHDALLAPLAEHADRSPVCVHIVDVDSYQLTHPESGGVEEFDDRGIAQDQGLRSLVSLFLEPLEHAADVVALQDAREVSSRFRSAQPRRGICSENPRLDAPPRERADRGDAAGEGGSGPALVLCRPEPIPEQPEVQFLRSGNPMSSRPRLQIEQVRAVRSNGLNTPATDRAELVEETLDGCRERRFSAATHSAMLRRTGSTDCAPPRAPLLRDTLQFGEREQFERLSDPESRCACNVDEREPSMTRKRVDDSEKLGVRGRLQGRRDGLLDVVLGPGFESLLRARQNLRPSIRDEPMAS